MKRIMYLAVALSVVAAPAFAADKTERLWKSKCGSCHGADGKAATEKGKKMKMTDLSTAAYQDKATDEQIKKIINEGVKTEKDGVKQEMDAYGDLSDEQKDGLLKFVRALKK